MHCQEGDFGYYYGREALKKSPDPPTVKMNTITAVILIRKHCFNLTIDYNTQTLYAPSAAIVIFLAGSR
jgi:hypothetical protein